MLEMCCLFIMKMDFFFLMVVSVVSVTGIVYENSSDDKSIEFNRSGLCTDTALRQPGERERIWGHGQMPELWHHHSSEGEAAGRSV